MTARSRTPRAARRAVLPLVGLIVVSATLYSILVPIHAAGYGTALPVALLLGAGICGAPLLALVWPRTSVAAFGVAAFALPLVIAGGRDAAGPWPWSVPALIAFAVFVLVLTARRGWRFGLVAWAIGVAGSIGSPLLLPQAADGAAVAADLIVAASTAAAALLVGMLIAGRIRVDAELRAERELTAIEHERRLVIEERTRIARELHDVVAHTMSVIQVQASTARYRITDLPAEAAAEFDELASVARGSLAEMRRLLGVLRTEDAAPQRAPQQGLGDLPQLVDSIRRAGIDVELAMTPARAEVPASVQLTAFRVVQEALSNAARHAPGAAIEVSVDAEVSPLTIRVHDDGTAGGVGDGGGHGLRGMRERVALAAGSLIVGPDPGGGWTVTAVLPWSKAGEESP